MSAENPSQNPNRIRHIKRGGVDAMGALAASGFLSRPERRPAPRELSPEEITRFQSLAETGGTQQETNESPATTAQPETAANTEPGVTIINSNETTRYYPDGTVETSPTPSGTEATYQGVRELADRIRAMAADAQQATEGAPTHEEGTHISEVTGDDKPVVIHGNNLSFGTVIGGQHHKR